VTWSFRNEGIAKELLSLSSLKYVRKVKEKCINMTNMVLKVYDKTVKRGRKKEHRRK
jgi:hypothetical protein